jgi:hypothetical protein
MQTPHRLNIPITEIFSSALVDEALEDEGITAEELAARFSAGAWDHYGPSEAEARRAIQYRQPLEAAFVLSRAGDVLIAHWQDGFLTLELEDDED